MSLTASTGGGGRPALCRPSLRPPLASHSVRSASIMAAARHPTDGTDGGMPLAWRRRAPAGTESVRGCDWWVCRRGLHAASVREEMGMRRECCLASAPTARLAATERRRDCANANRYSCVSTAGLFDTNRASLPISTAHAHKAIYTRSQSSARTPARRARARAVQPPLCKAAPRPNAQRAHVRCRRSLMPQPARQPARAPANQRARQPAARAQCSPADSLRLHLPSALSAHTSDARTSGAGDAAAAGAPRARKRGMHSPSLRPPLLKLTRVASAHNLGGRYRSSRAENARPGRMPSRRDRRRAHAGPRSRQCRRAQCSAAQLSKNWRERMARCAQHTASRAHTS